MQDLRKSPAGADQGLVAQMRLLVQTQERTSHSSGGDSDERVVAYTASITLMLLLVVLIFATSALPDLLPRLTNLVQARL